MHHDHDKLGHIHPHQDNDEIGSVIHSLTTISGVLIYLVFILSLTVMLGWFTHTETIVQISPTFAPMQFNTALCFMLASIAVLFYEYKKLKYVYYPLIIISLVSLMAIFEYLFGTNIGIDSLFVEPFLATNTLYPGRMAPNTATCFLIFSFVLFLKKIEVGFFLNFMNMSFVLLDSQLL